jgi:hypothetical protein
MNIIDIQDSLKNFSEQQLVSEMQRPSGTAPQFLVLSEIQRRKRVRDDFAKREAANQPTVAQEAVAAAGVPQSGIMGMREAMNPKRTMVQNMRSGGLMALGDDIRRGFSGKIEPFLDEVKGMAESRFDVDLDSQQRQNVRMPMVDPSRALNNPLTPRVGAGKGGTPTPTAGSSAFGSPLAMTQDFFSRSSYANENDYSKGIAGLMSNALPMKEGGVIKAQEGGPLGFRLNNVGNIRSGAGFYGETGSDSGYASFKDKESGLRALSRLINTYSDSYGIDNVRDFVGRYAPRSDNPKSFDNYVSYLSNQLGVDPDESFDLVGRRSELIPAIIGFEQGREYSDMFDDNTIARAIEASKFDDESKIESALYGKNDNEYNNFAKQLMQSIIPSAQASTIFPEPEVNDEKKVSRKQMYEDALNQSDYVPTDNSNIAVQKEGMEKAQQLRNLRNITSFSPFTTDEDGLTIADLTATPKVGSGKIGSLTPAEINANVMAERRIEQLEQKKADALKIAKARENKTLDIKNQAPEPISIFEPFTTDKNTSSKTENLTDKKDDESADTPKTETEKESNVTFSAGNPVSSLEQDIIDLQAKLEKSREQDKYLALAQAGLAIMASDSPTLAGAIGEGGVDGLKAFREANQRYEEGVIDLINARAKLRDDSKGGLTAASAITRINKIEDLLNPEPDATGIVTPLPADEQARLRSELNYLKYQILGYDLNA